LLALISWQLKNITQNAKNSEFVLVITGYVAKTLSQKLKERNINAFLITNSLKNLENLLLGKFTCETVGYLS
jgi:choline kinase